MRGAHLRARAAAVVCGLLPAAAVLLAGSLLLLGLLLSGAGSASARQLGPSPRASAGTQSDTSSVTSPATSSGSSSRWIAVSVATLWVRPGQARPVDAPSLAAPAEPRRWVAGMTTAQKRWLVGRLETQALYGTPVRLLSTSGSWSRIAVPSQPTPRNAQGYPGWVPTRQLTATPPALAPAQAPRLAVVRHVAAWAWASAAWDTRVMELSYGTRLAAVRWTPEAVEVVLLGGRHVYLRRAAVALHVPGQAWPPLSGAQLVAAARRFLGLQYLWAGTAGFGYDCSGFTYAVCRALGTTIPRDAGPQRDRGRVVASLGGLRPGDLVFFRNASGVIHHVGMFIGSGRMIHAPGTGMAVQVTSLVTGPYASEFAGGRRFTP